MLYSIKTDKGKQRENNQDACFAAYPDKASCFAVICDGMGGENAGEVASEMAVRIVSERVMAGWRPDITAESVKNLFVSAISAANICIFDEARSDYEKSGMGTTVVAAAVVGDVCIIAHVGDSRAFLINAELKKITRDHSYVQALIDNGLITPSEAAVHPKKNYITRALGTNTRVDVDCTVLNLSPGDKILLCSDGLTNYVSENDIQKTLKHENAEQAVCKLVDLANNSGGGDNISVAIITT